jgi:catechol 2,3-dioxygenase-like lactoylglutathione lyase family enzyme
MSLHIARNTADLTAMQTFYEKALNFQTIEVIDNDAALAVLLGAATVKRACLKLGATRLDLTETFPAYPAANFQGNETAFQHIAISTSNIRAAHAIAMRHGATAITRNGPQQLPKSSANVIAFKFRDPEGHPLEFLQFPTEKPPGYDHSAISISNLAASINFYAKLGLRQTAQGVNTGPEQAALDALPNVTADIIALSPPNPAPHLELLHYRSPAPIISPHRSPLSLAADRIILKSPEKTWKFLHDPDGHAIILAPDGSI